VGRHGGTRSSGDQPPTGRHQARPGGEPNAERCNATRPSTTLERRHPGDKMAEPDRADAAVSRCDRDHARGRPRARRRPLRHLTPLDGDGRVGFSHSLPVVSSRLPACYASALRQGGISSRRQVEKRAESLSVTVGARNTLDIGAKCFGGCVGDLMNSVADLLEANHTDLSMAVPSAQPAAFGACLFPRLLDRAGVVLAAAASDRRLRAAGLGADGGRSAWHLPSRVWHPPVERNPLPLPARGACLPAAPTCPRPRRRLASTRDCCHFRDRGRNRRRTLDGRRRPVRRAS
jgi:hypothetical protein